MSRCVDKEYGDRLYAFELGILSDEEQVDFEKHIIECPYCSQKATDFLEVTRIIEHDENLHGFTKALAEQGDDLEPRTRPAASKRSWFRKPLSMSMPLAAATLLILLLLDWQLYFKPADEAVAAENRLTILYFSNLSDASDPDHLSDIAANLLITDLGESAYFKVTSRERLLKVLADLGYDRILAGQPGTSTTVAKETGAKWMLTGEILEVEPELIISTQLIDVSTGDVVATQRVAGQPDEDIFAVVDSLSSQIVRDLPLLIPIANEVKRPISEITTTSPEAYRYYLDGLELYSKVYNVEAIAAFERALEYDSTLAMAYFYLSLVQDRTLIKKALEFSQNASRRESVYIKSLNAEQSRKFDRAIELLHELLDEYPEDQMALRQLGRIFSLLDKPDSAIIYLEEAVRLDPYFKSALNSLTYAYDAVGDFERAILTITRYIEIAPDEPNPYDTRGDLYSNRGMVKEALRSYEKALTLKSDFYYSLEKLGYQYLLLSNHERADSCFRILAAKGDYAQALTGRKYLAVSALYRGDFAEALLLLDSAISADTLGAAYEFAMADFLLKSRILVDLNRPDEGINVATAGLRIAEAHGVCGNRSRAFLVRTLAKQGNTVRARHELDALRILAQENDTAQAYVSYTEGCLSFDRGDFGAALEAFGDAARLAEFPRLSFMLGRTYLETGDLGRAAKEFEELRHSPKDLKLVLLKTKVQYYLGRTYEESQWFDKAAKQYVTFLNSWGKADIDLPIVSDAEARLERLGGLVP